MAWVRISAQDTTNNSATTSVTTTYGATPTAGNLLIATLYNSDPYTVLVRPAGWQLAVGSNDNSGHSSSIWWKKAGSSEPTAVTFSDAASGSMHLNIYEYTSVGNNFGVDQIASANSGASTVNSQSTGTTKFTINPNELLFATVIFPGSGSAPSWTNSFNARQNTTRVFDADLIVSATGAYTTTVTVTGTAVVMAGCIATFPESKKSFRPNTIRPHPFSPGLAR